MTDLNTLKDMLAHTDIKYEQLNINGQPALNVERGYIGFVTQFIFTEEGALADMGAYE